MLKIDIRKNFKNNSYYYKFEINRKRGVLFGPSGCGKSTLLRLLTGFTTPDEGEINIDGAVIYSSKKRINIPIYRRNFGYLPQDSTLFPNMKIIDNITYGIKARKLKVELKEIKKLCERLQIADKLESYPAFLSGGQKQRTALARVLMIKPKLLLLDEPFSALDTPIKNCLRDIVIDISEEMEIPMLFVTHDSEDSYYMGSELIVINKGEVIECGDVEKVAYSPNLVETAKLLDFKNIFKVKEINEKEIVLDLPNIMPILKSTNNIDKNFNFVSIKPESVKILSPLEIKFQKPDNVLNATVASLHFRGKYCKADIVCENGLVLESHLPASDYINQYVSQNTKVLISIEKNSIIKLY